MIKRTGKLYRKHECCSSAREKLISLIEDEKVNPGTALVACVKAMSEDTCASVLDALAKSALFGNEADPDVMPADDQIVNTDDIDALDDTDNDDWSVEVDGIEDDDLDDEDSDKDDLDEDSTDDEDADESCRREALQRRVARLEKCLHRDKHFNEKGLFDFFHKKKEPAETKLDLKSFQRMGKDFLEKVCDKFKYDYKPSGKIEARSSHVSCGWMNGAQTLILFNNGAPTWSMVGSDRAIEKSMPKGNMQVEDGELKFADSNDWNRIRNALKIQSDFTREENTRRDKQLAKDRAAADAARAKQNRKDDVWFSNRMNPYTTDWL